MRPPKIDKSKPWIGVCLTPALIDTFEVDQAIVVVIDVLRATTTMCVAFDHGVRSMIPVRTIEEGREYQKKGHLAAAERNGEQIDGFDFGNSPFSFMNKRIAGKDIVVSTTNGTQAIQAAVERNAKEVVVGSFANISLLADYLVSRNENVIFLCAGWKNKPNLEDSIFAGAMVKKLRPHFWLYEDAAIIAETLFRNANRRKRWYLRNSSHFMRLYHILQIQKDVKYALRRDTHPVIPQLVGKHLVDINGKYYKEFVKAHKAELAKAQKDAPAKNKASDSPAEEPIVKN